jgi:phosphoglycolate phosphatase
MLKRDFSYLCSMSINLLVFDLDGTLVDSVSDLATAVNRAFSDISLPSVTEAQVRRAIGEGARVLLARLVPAGSDDAVIDQAWARFRVHYLDVCCEQTALLPGVTEFLDARRAEAPTRPMSLLTNKPQEPTDRLVKHLGLDRWLGDILGGDTALGRKPDPAGLRDLAQRAGVALHEVLLIGDGPADLAVAQAAGVRTLLLRDGYGHSEELSRYQATWTVSSLEEAEARWPEIVRAFAVQDQAESVQQ